MARFNLAITYLELKQYPKAADAAREAIRLDAAHADSHGVLGVALLEAGDLVGGRIAIERAVQLAPGGSTPS